MSPPCRILEETVKNQDFMPKNKKQLLRMVKFVSELKQNKYPNTKSFAKTLRELDLTDNLNITCSPRTIKRDIRILIDDFHAPIIFDPEKNGYYLTSHYWEFQCPQLCDNMIFTSLLAVRLAEDIVPEPLKGEMRKSIDTQLTTNNSEFLDDAFIDSLLVASAAKVSVKTEIFRTVFDGWRTRKAIKMTYRKPDGKFSEGIFEPHIIAFHKGIWYTKGIKLPEEEERVYGLQRIASVELTDGIFEINKKMLEDVQKNGLFNFPKLENVMLQCDASIAFYLYEHSKAKKLKIVPMENGDLIVTMPPAIEHDLIRWILGEGGKIQVLQPVALRKKILHAAEQTIVANTIG